MAHEPVAFLDCPWGRAEIAATFNIGRSSDFSPLAAELERYKTVSGVHATISFCEFEWIIRDLNSTNGTLVNGVALQMGEEFVLHDRDRIHFSRGFSAVFRTGDGV